VAASAALAAASTDRDVVCVPALAGLAAPYWQTQLRGAFFGLSRATTPADLVRATLDGLACRVVDVVAAMQADHASGGSAPFPPYLKVDGGPASNAYLMQAVADLANLEVRVAAARESTAIGMAHLAAHSALGLSLADLAARWQAEAVYTPRLSADERAARLDRWRRAVASLMHFHGAAVE
jgi:glycerol kinase